MTCQRSVIRPVAPNSKPSTRCLPSSTVRRPPGSSVVRALVLSVRNKRWSAAACRRSRPTWRRTRRSGSSRASSADAMRRCGLGHILDRRINRSAGAGIEAEAWQRLVGQARAPGEAVVRRSAAERGRDLRRRRVEVALVCAPSAGRRSTAAVAEVDRIEKIGGDRIGLGPHDVAGHVDDGADPRPVGIGVEQVGGVAVGDRAELVAALLARHLEAGDERRGGRAGVELGEDVATG